MLQELLQEYPLSHFEWVANLEQDLFKGQYHGHAWNGSVFHSWSIYDRETNKRVYEVPRICTSGEFGGTHEAILMDEQGNIVLEEVLQLWDGEEEE